MSDQHFHAPISEQIWDKKYRLRDENKEPLEASVTDTWRRIAKALAQAEKETDQPMYEAMFYDALEGFKFLPAGRITAGAGTGRSVTLFNCLAGETLIPTVEYGIVPISEIAGGVIHVLDGDGRWIESPINSFGDQPVAPVYLRGGYNGRERKVIRATAGHRWILENGTEVTTEQLSAGHPLKQVRRKSLKGALDYKAGVRHGLIYGDGSYERTDSEGFCTFRIRLCGDKSYLSPWLTSEGASITLPPSFDGDSLVRLVGCRTDLKALPESWAGEAYISGFLHGWLATDGCVSRSQPLLSCGATELEWLRRYGAIAGMEVSSASQLQDDTNYGNRKKALFNVHFHRATMIPEDFLLPKHRESFGETPNYPWIVESVGPYGDPEPVYCPNVVTTSSFQLDLGIHTGNCFVMGTVPDSMRGIFEALKEAALTMQQGGGIGYDFSTLRPNGALVKGVAADASGPLTFMDCWDSMCRTVMSAGSRRGAMMATMRVDHPDIMDFITAKRNATRLRMFNMSVLVTDKFMQAVKNDAAFDLVFGDRVYETVRAQDLWDAIMQTTYDVAEPGVIFIDRINADNNLQYMETIASTNPCGEQPLPPYGACLLGSINLAAMVKKPFTDGAYINQTALENLVSVAIRMMDNVVDVSNFPLPQQKAEAKMKRRLGLGVTGVADALLMYGLTYGSAEAAAKVEKWMEIIDQAAYRASILLAKEKGAFPGFQVDGYLAEGTHASRHPRDITDGIRKHGIRNSHLTSIAPTGTISMYAGNVSSGIEPVFAFTYDRKILNDDGTKRTEAVDDFAYREYLKSIAHLGNESAEAVLPDHFVSAQTLSPMAHVRMQAAAQKHVDSSISKTINCPVDITFEDFKGIYMAAWDAGCKGCTTYRPNDVTGSILSVSEAPAAVVQLPSPDGPDTFVTLPNGKLGLDVTQTIRAALGSSEGEAALKDFIQNRKPLTHEEPMARPAELDGTMIYDDPNGPENTPVWINLGQSEEPMARPAELDGTTYKLKWPGSDHSIYITITDVEDHGRLRPFEVFINSKNMDHFAWTVALTRMISAVFRRPHDSSFVVDELKAVFDPKGGAWMDGKYVPSVLAAIGGVIEKHMKDIGYIGGPVPFASRSPMEHERDLPEPARRVAVPAAMAAPYGQPAPAMCPACHSSNVKKEAGCFVCKDCGNSNCG